MMMKVLKGFHHSIKRWIARVTARKGNRGEWEWSSVDAALEVTGIWTIREYVRRQQAKIS